jgi:hypothetical protein
MKNSCLKWGAPLSSDEMATRVNLDALICRKDFDETIAKPPSQKGKRKETLSVTDLKKGEFFFGTLCKPDFQRETNDWDTARIIDLIKSFLDISKQVHRKRLSEPVYFQDRFTVFLTKFTKTRK